MTSLAMGHFGPHFSELCGLSSLYRNATVSYLNFSVDEKMHIRRYTHELKYGQPPHLGTDYGIQHAARCGWNPSVIEEASKLRRLMMERSKNEDAARALRTTAQHAGRIHSTIKRLMVLGKHKHQHSMRSDTSSLVSYVHAAMKLLPRKQDVQKYLGLDATTPTNLVQDGTDAAFDVTHATSVNIGEMSNSADQNVSAPERPGSGSQPSPVESQHIPDGRDPPLLNSSSFAPLSTLSSSSDEDEEIGGDEKYVKSSSAKKVLFSNKAPGFYSKK